MNRLLSGLCAVALLGLPGCGTQVQPPAVVRTPVPVAQPPEEGRTVKPISTLGTKCAIRLTIQSILARKAVPENRRSIKSTAFDAGEIICPAHFPVHRKLVKYGIGCTGKTARRLIYVGYHRFGLLA